MALSTLHIKARSYAKEKCEPLVPISNHQFHPQIFFLSKFLKQGVTLITITYPKPILT